MVGSLKVCPVHDNLFNRLPFLVPLLSNNLTFSPIISHRGCHGSDPLWPGQATEDANGLRGADNDPICSQHIRAAVLDQHIAGDFGQFNQDKGHRVHEKW